MAYPASQLSNWKSAPTIQPLWTVLSMRSPGEPTYCQQCPTMPQHTSLTSTSPVTKVLAKWMMTVPYKSDRNTELKECTQSMAPVHFFLVLAQKGEREGTESEKVEKENPREAKHWVDPSCQGLENPKAPPISLIQSNLLNWVAFSLIRCLVICCVWMSRA